jgi:hypothetical protein
MIKLSSHPWSRQHHFRDRNDAQHSTVDSSTLWQQSQITRKRIIYIVRDSLLRTFLFECQDLKASVVILNGKGLRNYVTIVQGYWRPLMNLNGESKVDTFRGNINVMESYRVFEFEILRLWWMCELKFYVQVLAQSHAANRVRE